jgi:molybdenum cofactor cytidylyltransferase
MGGLAKGTAVQIVLAAGRSERMGTTKALLPFGKRSALALALDAAAGAGLQESIVVVGANAGEIRAAQDGASCATKVTWVRNEEAGSEQLRSLQVGLSAFDWERVESFFIHPVDYPLATSQDYLLLLEALAAGKPEATVYLLSHNGRRGHPVLFRAALAEKFLALRPGATARDVVEAEKHAYVVTENSGVLEDMDTPEDYERLLGGYLRRTE